MKRKELEKLPVLKAPVSMLKQVENETLIEKPYYKNRNPRCRWKTTVV